MTPEGLRGRAYGLRQALDTVGAFLGPLAALAAMAVFADNIRTVFWLAVLPGFLALAVLAWGVDEPSAPPLQPDGEDRASIQVVDLRKLDLAFWMIVAVGAVLTLARFSEAFLLLRAHSVGLPAAYVPLVLIVMNVVYATSAYPAGVFADRLDRRALLGVGFVVLIGSDLVLGLASRIWTVMAGVALWGLHMGLTQGLLSAMVAAAAPAALRGSAFGIFNLISGLTLLVASTIAGLLWDWFGASAAFYAGATVTAVGLAGMALTNFPNGNCANDHCWGVPGASRLRIPKCGRLTFIESLGKPTSLSTERVPDASLLSRNPGFDLDQCHSPGLRLTCVLARGTFREAYTPRR